MYFWHKLALRLGMTVREVQEKVDAKEFAMWVAYDRMNPIGDDRVDLLFGSLSALIFNIKRGKRTPSKTANEFMPRWSIEASRQTPEEMQKRLLAGFKQHNIAVIYKD